MITPPTLTQLLPVLQVAIGPVILISGVGLLLLSMTNRYARTIDRARELSYARRLPDGDRERFEQQIRILWHRAQVLRRAIFLATFSVLSAALLIITLFVAVLTKMDVGWLVAAIFIACLATLIASLIDFIRDVNMSLRAVRLEIES